MALDEMPTIELDAKDFEESEPTEVEDDTTPSEPSADDKKDDQPATGDDKKAEEADDDAKGDDDKAEEDESEDDKSAEDDPKATEDDPKPKKGAEARKSELQSEIRGLVNRRNELRVEIAQRNGQVYKAQTAEELQAEGLSPEMAEIQALKQANQMNDFNAHVTDLNANLNIESLQVMSDFPVFDPDSPDYDESLATRARTVYEKVAGIQTDPKTKLIVKANVLPYEIYKAFAETAASSVKRGEVSGQKAAEQNLAAAEVITPSSAPKKSKEDPFLKGLLAGTSLEKR